MDILGALCAPGMLETLPHCSVLDLLSHPSLTQLCPPNFLKPHTTLCSGDKQPDDSCYYAAELHDDMITYDAPVHLSVQGAMGPYGPGKADDKPFLHKFNGTYYLSWGVFYGTSPSIFGPYQYRGTFLDPKRIAPDFRIGNASKLPWYTREDYADRHGSFVEWQGQWYFFMNDRSHSDFNSPNGTNWPGGFRDTVAAYVHYREDGSIEPLVVNKQGVGSHDATSPVRAENFFALELGSKRQHADGRGFKVSGLRAGSLLLYRKVQLPHARAGSTFVPVLRGAGGCRSSMSTALLRRGGRHGVVLATCHFPFSPRDAFANMPCINTGAGNTTLISGDIADLALTFEGCDGAAFAELDSIAFVPA